MNEKPSLPGERDFKVGGRPPVPISKEEESKQRAERLMKNVERTERDFTLMLASATAIGKILEPFPALERDIVHGMSACLRQYLNYHFEAGLFRPPASETEKEAPVSVSRPDLPGQNIESARHDIAHQIQRLTEQLNQAAQDADVVGLTVSAFQSFRSGDKNERISVTVREDRKY